MKINWKERCEEIGKSWIIGCNNTAVFHPTKFKDALFIREYMTSHYADIDIFIICEGFIWGTDIAHLGK